MGLTMFWDDIVAIGIIVCFIVTIIFLIKSFKILTAKQFMNSLVKGLLLGAVLNFILPIYMRRGLSGTLPPFNVFSILFCLGFILFFVKSKLIRLILSFLFMMFLVFWVDGFRPIFWKYFESAETIQKNISSLQQYNHSTQTSLSKMKTKLTKLAADHDESYPEGWLAESLLKTLLLETKGDPYIFDHDFYANYYEIKTYNLWHGFITGLYGSASRKNKIFSIYYPGGPIKDVVEDLEFREKEISNIDSRYEDLRYEL